MTSPDPGHDEIEVVRQMAERGEIAAALARLDYLLKQDPGDVDLAYTRARIFAVHVGFHFALPEVTFYCAAHPRDLGGQELLASLYLRNGRPGDALQALRTAETSVGLTDFGRLEQIRAFQLLGRNDEAKRLTILGSSSGQATASALFASDALSPAIDEDAMLKVASRLRDAGERSATVAMYVGRWYTDHDQLLLAEQTLADSLQKHPFDSNLTLYLARVEQLLGRDEDALARVTGIFNRNPADPWAGGWLCNYYRRRWRLVDAFRISMKATRATVALSSKKNSGKG